MDKEKPLRLPPTGRFPSFSPSTTTTTTPQTTSFSHDLSLMTENPPKNSGHRRAHSEILSLPDDITFVGDLADVDGCDEGPSMSDDTEDDVFSMYIDMDKVSSETGVRSRHQHSQSMDGSTTMKPEMFIGSGSGGGGDEVSVVEAKKAMSAAKLAELALIDPKRAKRWTFC